MIVGIVTAVLGVLLASFLALTAAEARTGRRVMAPARERLDARVTAGRAYLRALDLEHTLLRKAVAGASLVAHEVAHGMLIGIRALERALTRATRRLRERAAEEVE